LADVDDERLLDLALGLEDDPEVRDAVSRSAELQQRLVELEADLRAIDRELHGVLPPVEEGWHDPASESWRRLQPFFAEPRGRSWRLGRRGRVLVPAIALVVLASLIVGVIASGGRGRSATSVSGGGATQTVEHGPADAARAGEFQFLASSASAYGAVVIAEAGPVRGASQSFTVVRTLKGSVPSPFEVGVATRGGAVPGSLQIVYLEPLSEVAGTALGAAATGSVTPAPAPSASTSVAAAAPAGAKAAGQTFAPHRALIATYGGKQAILEPLPVGVDPASVTLP